MTVREIYNKEVITIKRFSSIFHAVQLMRQYNTGELVVIDEENEKIVPAGILTDLDIIEKTVAEDMRLDAVMVEEIMNTQPVMVSEYDSISSSFQVMREKGFRNLPVVDDRGSLVGTISMKSILDYQSKEAITTQESLISEQKQNEKEKIKERESEIRYHPVST
jgi:CBS domain-containing protein